MSSDSEIDLPRAVHYTRVQAVRLQRRAVRIKEEIWRGSQRDLIDALADCAEATTIAGRIYDTVQQIIKTRSST